MNGIMLTVDHFSIDYSSRGLNRSDKVSTFLAKVTFKQKSPTCAWFLQVQDTLIQSNKDSICNFKLQLSTEQCLAFDNIYIQYGRWAHLFTPVFLLSISAVSGLD